MTVDWTPVAIAHLQAAYEYIAEENEKAAESLVGRIFSAVERLGQYPHMGRSGRVDGSRELMIPGTQFVVAYRANMKQIIVLAVLHAARKWPGEF